MSVKKDEQNETIPPPPPESLSAQSAEGLDEMGAATSGLVMDFGNGQQVPEPEPITLDILQRMIHENPRQMAYAVNQPIKESLRRSAVFLLLVGARVVLDAL